MINQTKSYFYYPTNVVLVDDDKEFLKEMCSNLNEQGDKLVKTFFEPKRVLSYLKSQSGIYENYQKYLERVNLIETDIDGKDKITRINFERICALPHDKGRYNEISVIAADLFMPQMNGIDFFKEIKDTPIKKILLTGNADYKLAVDAFNDGIIDKFIIKEEEGMQEKLFESISSFKGKYFQEFSETLLQVFDKGIKKTIQYNFAFSSWCAGHKISEYYQCDSNGSCFGLDENWETHWLLICSEKEALEYVAIAENFEETCPALNELKSNKRLLFFLTEADKQFPPASWGKNMFPIRGDFVVDNEKYFYSFVSEK